MNWVDCREAMPKKYEEVLVWVVYKSGNYDFTDSWLGDEGWEMGSAKGFTVTHWMRIVTPNES